MARFAMLILCDRAQRRGVRNVDYIVMEGNIRKQLRQFAIDTHADLMIMGAPTPGPGKNMFKQEELKQFIHEMEQEGNLRIMPDSHPQTTPQVDAWMLIGSRGLKPAAVASIHHPSSPYGG